ncbi:SanA/YdcF family protein [Goodfellowiella coeruleoviolacea]|uniref:Protein SanA, affects membrane permeability for vancomycin n=1 Tax=Goodfellowiella coeruleoviolacea TaxID=334858 RepID=A0AAE3KFZ7_9PSEU|nr:ElyC/SanA/YdcF family protein [Goodfellowiella coeruleoviolacea]MCP2164944.1 protein SanA, affects membrane permeability for vancomycin [Goodfellowiella coeruleoviolacea]
MRKPWRWVLIVGGLLATLGLAPITWAYASSAAYRSTPEEVPEAPVALVLGAGLTRQGTPSQFLAGRLDVAADLYRRGKVKVLLVSGDNSTTDYDEPSAMRAYLIGRGVPDRVIVADYAGFDTWDSCSRARRIFGVDRAIVVTQNFHLPRAVALCRAAGIDAYGVGHDSSGINNGVGTYYGYVREAFASGKAMWDALVAKPDPRLLGPAETGVTDALRSDEQ